MRKRRHIRFVLGLITDLNNEISTLCRLIEGTDPNSTKEHFYLSKMRFKVSLMRKYNRRLKILTI